MSRLSLATLVFATALVLSSCAWWQADEAAPIAEKDAHASEQEAAYQACLERSQAMAIAWEMIEQMCRKEVGLEEGGLPTLE